MEDRMHLLFFFLSDSSEWQLHRLTAVKGRESNSYGLKCACEDNSKGDNIYMLHVDKGNGKKGSTL